LCVLTHPQEREPFISELLSSLFATIQDLQPHQVRGCPAASHAWAVLRAVRLCMQSCCANRPHTVGKGRVEGSKETVCALSPQNKHI